MHLLSGSCWEQQSRGCLGRSPRCHMSFCTRSGDQLILLFCLVCKTGSCFVASVTPSLAMQARMALSFQETAYLHLPECWDHKHALSCPASNNFTEINIPDHRYTFFMIIQFQEHQTCALRSRGAQKFYSGYFPWANFYIKHYLIIHLFCI